ncbi:PaaI family thioesterase [Ammoniphilus sp. 3BR4]
MKRLKPIGMCKKRIMQTLTKEQWIEQIKDKLYLLNGPQLETLNQAINSLQIASNERFHNLGRIMGIEWNEQGEFQMHLGAFNANTYGVAQGGALYTLADVAIGYMILEQLRESQKVFTLEMKMNFIKKGKGDKLTAKPKVLHWGRKTVVAQCEVYDEMRNLVAQSMGTFFVVDEATGG